LRRANGLRKHLLNDIIDPSQHLESLYLEGVFLPVRDQNANASLTMGFLVKAIKDGRA
jgi:hypothetical protein